MLQKEHYVLPSSKGGWIVQRSGAKQANAHTKTKEEAVRIAKVIGQRSGSVLIIRDKEESSQA